MRKYMTAEYTDMKKFFAMNSTHMHRRQNVLFIQNCRIFIQFKFLLHLILNIDDRKCNNNKYNFMYKSMIIEFIDMRKIFAMNSAHMHRRQNVLFRQKSVEFLLNSNFYYINLKY